MTALGHIADSDTEGLMNMDAPAERYPLPEATRLILGDNHGLKDPERWVAKQLRTGRFRGQKIGRNWFMRAVDIEAAEAALTPEPRIEKLSAEVESAFVPPADIDMLAGASARSRRRARRNPRDWR